MASYRKKSQKTQARQEIDLVINNTIFLESQVAKPSHSNRHNIISVLVSYAVALQKETTPTTIQFHNPPQYTVKRHINASYDVDNITAFPAIGNKKGKISKNLTTFTRPPPTLPLSSQMKNLPMFPISPTTTFLRCSKRTIRLSRKKSKPPLK